MKLVLAVATLVMLTGAAEASAKSWWIPTGIPGSATEWETKTSDQFQGTLMKFKRVFPTLRYDEISDRRRGFPVPPHPTGQHQWRRIGPGIRLEADIHMPPEAVQQMENNEKIFAQIMTTILPAPADDFFKLGHAIYSFGLAHAKNGDGSLDADISPSQVTAGGHLVLVDPELCMAIIQAG
jgi:hypothetical protein